jgi:hypothetical protein
VLAAKAFAHDFGGRAGRKENRPAAKLGARLFAGAIGGVAATTQLTLSATTVAEILLALRQQKKTKARVRCAFRLVPGQKPVIVIEPWNVEIRESDYSYAGEAQEIRIWGRRRLFALEELLPHAQSVDVRLLGSGMPSYWSVTLQGHRFDMGLSGWTENDWSSAARFDLLASTSPVSQGDVEQAASQLENALALTPDELAARSDLSRQSATSALQQLCREGRAMFDLHTDKYRWRQLLPFPAPQGEEDKKLASARRWVVKDRSSAKRSRTTKSCRNLRLRFVEKVCASSTPKCARRWPVRADDWPGCRWSRRFRAMHLRRVSAEQAAQRPVRAHSGGECVAATSGGANVSKERFKDQTWVFTGALSLFTREAAEALITQGGGHARAASAKTPTFWWPVNAPDRSWPKRSSWAFRFNRAGI